MSLSKQQQHLLRCLPGVDHILALTDRDQWFSHIPRKLRVTLIRKRIDDLRAAILTNRNTPLESALTDEALLQAIRSDARMAITPNLKRVVNATGIVVHTNLGRSCLAEEVLNHLRTIASHYSNLEFDLSRGARGSRYSAVTDIICEISGAESAMVVNNNAGAVLLCLDTIARDREVIVSRGELVEIGGAFRIPDVMAKSGAILKEVGTTNRTHLKDYDHAINENTALLLKVHQSNYSIVGFTAEVRLPELVTLAEKYDLPVMEDLGSGTFIDFSAYSLYKEPTVQESVAAGTDVVTFSGDKLLGGPQAGLIVGKRSIIETIQKNPLTRALRIDKMTLAALEGTLRLYRNESEAIKAIPTLHRITMPLEAVARRAKHLAELLLAEQEKELEVTLIDRPSKAGGGSLPLLEIPSKCVAIHKRGWSAATIEKRMRAHDPPIIGRIEEDTFIMDARTLDDEEAPIIARAFAALWKGDAP